MIRCTLMSYSSQAQQDCVQKKRISCSFLPGACCRRHGTVQEQPPHHEKQGCAWAFEQSYDKAWVLIPQTQNFVYYQQKNFTPGAQDGINPHVTELERNWGKCHILIISSHQQSHSKPTEFSVPQYWVLQAEAFTSRCPSPDEHQISSNPHTLTYVFSSWYVTLMIKSVFAGSLWWCETRPRSHNGKGTILSPFPSVFNHWRRSQ